MRGLPEHASSDEARGAVAVAARRYRQRRDPVLGNTRGGGGDDGSGLPRGGSSAAQQEVRILATKMKGVEGPWRRGATGGDEPTKMMGL